MRYLNDIAKARGSIGPSLPGIANMHKFYWHNNSHAGNGGGGGGGGNGSNRAGPAGGSHGSSQPAVASASAASQSQRAGRGGHSSSSSPSVAMRMSDAPSVPHRNGVTVRVKTDGEGGDDAKSAKGSHTPSGSHRVLLKLRRMSGGGGGSGSRPKSVSDATEIPGSATEIPGAAPENPGNTGRMRGSRSMHQMFHYNKTWNERSLSKCLREEGGQHNYENIYSGDKDANEDADFNPLYENVAYHQYQYPFVSLGNPVRDEGGGSLVIGQLTSSPRSTARSRRKPQTQNMSNGNSGGNSNNNGLFRSKSCERPKMRDAVRETQQHLVSNFNRLLQNRFGVGSSNSNNNNNSGSALTSSTSMFMGGDSSSGYKSFHSGADDLQPQVRERNFTRRVERKQLLCGKNNGNNVAAMNR